LEDLIHLKNQIHIKKENEMSENDLLKSKCKILIFFKNTISNIEEIIEYMNILRSKGSSLPIKINMTITIKDKEPTVKYKLGEEENKTFEDIKKFLFEAKNSYITQLDLLYKEKVNLRFLYGKQFRSFMKHLESNFKIDPILRYILNITENTTSIYGGFKALIRNVEDYINHYKLYNRNSLNAISNYITSLFDKNNKKLDYEGMIITSKESCKGIDLYECENNSMEKSILNIFWEKLVILPIAQNILIANKETSSDQIQAFFCRAILCNYNTLFVVEINDSFSEYQQSIMNSYIDNLLSFKKKKYKEETKEDVDKLKTDKYLDSYIVFICEKENKNITAFINEIKRFIPTKEDEKKVAKKSSSDKNDIDFSSKFENIQIITSDICGLGKSETIKKIVAEENTTYFTFQLGGILTKSII
jgi:hypothetical protein